MQVPSEASVAKGMGLLLRNSLAEDFHVSSTTSNNVLWLFQSLTLPTHYSGGICNKT